VAYQVFQPCGGRCGIPRGRLSLSARGMARLAAADLAAVGVADSATLLIDRERRSLAVRAPLEGEAGQLVGKEKSGPSRTVWLRGAMLAVGLKPADFHGWHECRVSEDRLEIRFEDSPRKRRESA